VDDPLLSVSFCSAPRVGRRGPTLCLVQDAAIGCRWLEKDVSVTRGFVEVVARGCCYRTIPPACAGKAQLLECDSGCGDCVDRYLNREDRRGAGDVSVASKFFSDKEGTMNGVDRGGLNYGHHPTEIRPRLQARGECGQPRRVTFVSTTRTPRTQALMEEFCLRLLADARILQVVYIYAPAGADEG